MPFLTVPEFYSLRLFELDNRIFRQIERAYQRILGDRSLSFLLRHMDKTVAEMCTTSCVDVLSYLMIL